MNAVMVLPDHLHCVLSLPDGGADDSMPLGLIKATFLRAIEPGERRYVSRLKRGERGTWQRRFGEHCIRDEADSGRHVDYIHGISGEVGSRGARGRLAIFRFS